jgi:hypothetical protein
MFSLQNVEPVGVDLRHAISQIGKRHDSPPGIKLRRTADHRRRRGRSLADSISVGECGVPLLLTAWILDKHRYRTSKKTI